MENYAQNRAIIFLFIFIGLSLLEFVFSFHSQHDYRPWKRKGFNLLIFLLGILVSKSFQPFFVMLFTKQIQFSFNLASLLDLPSLLENILFLFILDFVIYWQHRLFHTVPLLWKLHALHHEDYDLDVTSALRFHPIEILISLMIKWIVVSLTGISIQYYLVFEILLNSLAMFNHANLYLPNWADKILGSIIITPRLHVLHHYQPKKYHNQNYGFSIVLWDRLFGSFCWNNQDLIKKNVIGLAGDKYSPQKTLDLKSKLSLK